MANVNFNNVSKHFGSFVAVDNLNLDISNREFVVLVGPSGCGKSTTLRMLAGLDSVTDGEIRIDQQRVNEIHPRDRDIAMVFQNYALYPHMTVEQNMTLNLKVRKISPDEIKKRLNYAAEVLGIETLLGRRPSELSGGQKQRVAVGRAIVREPKVFLFDEPLSNLDAKLRVQMRAEIGSLHSRLKSTMVYVTHDQIEAMTLGTRIVIMKDGIVQQVAPPLEIFSQPANIFVAGFIGSPPMNFIEGHIRQQDGLRFINSDGSVSLKVGSAVAKYVDKPVVFGVRPEHLASSKGAGVLFNAKILRQEPLGSELIVHLGVGPETLTCRLPAEKPLTGETIQLGCAPEKFRFFDKQTGLRI